MNDVNKAATTYIKSILVFGAGKSATVLIDYLIEEAANEQWQLTVVDNDLALAQSKLGKHDHAKAISINVEHAAARNKLIREADIVISLLPPVLHFLVAQDCVALGKNLLTASYTDDKIKSLKADIEEKKLLFICEMGLDPGIDHMSAMELIHRIKKDGGVVTSFTSHCGGLVAPESDDNPWHYKISWNPRNVVTAGKAGAVYRQQNETVRKAYEDLFDPSRKVCIPEIGELSWYPNRDSLSYIDLYELHSAENFIRTTLRYPAYCAGWKKIIELRLTDESILYETTGLSLAGFFEQHFRQQGFAGYIQQLKDTDPFLHQLLYIGLHDADTIVNKGHCSAMDILQFALEKKWVLGTNDKDIIIMLHEVEYLQDGHKYTVKTSLVVKGDNNTRTAMAKTVGLPLGIAAKLILQGVITETGLHIPVIPAIYEPVLKELGKFGVIFYEDLSAL